MNNEGATQVDERDISSDASGMITAKLIHNVSTDLEKKEYIVISKNGLLKNGRLYENGSTILLDAITADNFIKAGDIKNVQ
jgi:hypothetical protein